jgi:ABC-type sugar transport system ATPase subunit
VEFRRGEIHALLGENGAGKTTLTRMIAGVIQPDGGEILLRGEPLTLHSPAHALSLGIGLIHQELSLVPEMSVAANMFLGREPRTRRGSIDDRTMRRRTGELLRYMGATFDGSMLVSQLSVAQQQLVEIARVIDRRPELLIMDEPSASLSAEGIERLYAIVRELRGQGVAIVYISHDLDEVFKLADRVTVLKDGRVTLSKPTVETNVEEVVRMMVGRSLVDLFPRRPSQPGGPPPAVLAVEGLSLPGHFESVSFELRAGEILGLAGLVGAGRSALAQSLFGAPPDPLLPRDLKGTIRLDGQQTAIGSPRRAARLGIGFVPEDRKSEGLLLGRSVVENIALPQLDELVRGPFVSRAERARTAGEQIAALRIVAPSPRSPLTSLSGGNQQKVVLAKWLAKRCRVLLLDEPTRGVDIGAKTEIYELIRKLAGKGVSILLISSSIPEILGLSDRIIVMSRGRVIAEHAAEAATEEALISAAFGLETEERGE